MGWLSSRKSRWIWKWPKTELGCKSYDKFRDAHVDTRLRNGLKPNWDGLRWKKFQHESCASRRSGWFWYKKRLNRSSYAKVTAENARLHQDGRTLREWSSGFWISPRMAGHSGGVCPGFGFFCRRLWKTTENSFKMTSDKKMFNMKVVRLVETVKIAFGLVSIRGCLLPQMWPARCSQVVNRIVLESSDSELD